MITIKDIAKRAGVTPTTVSRVINNRGYISEETRAKVMEVMRELNYQPNEVARSLGKKHTHTVGLIVPHVIHPFFSELIHHLEAEATAEGYKILLCNSRDQRERELEYIDMFISNRVSGIILCSQYLDTEMFSELNIPLINLEREDLSSAISIQSDNYLGGQLAARHLIETGAKQLLHIGGEVRRDVPASRRWDGFKDVCAEHGVACELYITDLEAYQSMEYYELIRSVLEARPRVDGIFTSSDLIAAQIIQVCAEKGITVPGDIAVVGYDDTFLARLTTPTITTIHQEIPEMARLAIDCILASQKGEVTETKYVLPVTLVKRSSTK